MSVDLLVERPCFDCLRDTSEVGAENRIGNNVLLEARESFPGRGIEMCTLDSSIYMFDGGTTATARTFFNYLGIVPFG
jgi:hypothetical protein